MILLRASFLSFPDDFPEFSMQGIPDLAEVTNWLQVASICHRCFKPGFASDDSESLVMSGCFTLKAMDFLLLSISATDLLLMFFSKDGVSISVL